jgi:uncharacterized protein (DUF2384 family)
VAAKKRRKTERRKIATLKALKADLAALEQPMGRPRSRIALDQVERLASIFCTDEDIAGYFGVSLRTIERHKKQAKYKEALEKGHARGRISLRRLQWITANYGERASAIMQIWLGKQYLGQKDRIANEHTGRDGAPIEVADARSRLADLLAKRAAARGPREAPSEPDGQ